MVVKGACACLAGSAGLEANRDLITSIGGKLMSVKAFLLVFSHIDISLNL